MRASASRARNARVARARDSPCAQTDFVIVGVALPDSNDLSHALLPSLHNPKRALLQEVIITSNNKLHCEFVLIGDAWDVPCDDHTPEAHASFIRNRRRAIAKSEEMTDFVIMGVADPESDHRFALIPERHNPKRVALRSVVLVSNHHRLSDYTDYALVGTCQEVAPNALDGPQAQAAWLRNRRRSMLSPETERYPLIASHHLATPPANRWCDLGNTAISPSADPSVRSPCAKLPGGVYDCSYSSVPPGKGGPDWVFYEAPRVDTPIPKRRELMPPPPKPKLAPQRREERTSGNSVISLLD